MNEQSKQSVLSGTVSGRGRKSSYLGYDLAAIKMKLRTSTVMQRVCRRPELKTGREISASITCRRSLDPGDRSEKKIPLSSGMTTDEEEQLNDCNNNIDSNNNDNSSICFNNYQERLSLEQLCQETQTYVYEPAHMDNSKRAFIRNDGRSSQQPVDAYLGQATRKRTRLMKADNCTTESHQSASSSSSYNVPDSTTCYCSNKYTGIHHATATATATATAVVVARTGQQDLQISPRRSVELTTSPLKSRNFGLPRKLMSLGELNGRKNVSADKHMPWFGIDIGGTLIKVVFFDPKEATREELVTLKRIRRYLKSSKAYGTTGKRDAHLEMSNCVMNNREGSLHFIRFATSQMPDFLALAKDKKLAETIDRVCATGGGAYKFEDEIRTSLGIKLNKTDELDSIIYGIHYIDKYNAERECYFLEDPLDDAKCVKVPYDFSQPYPYLVVNIGSGVSILAVYSSTSYSRISGSSIGGGTFLGLCSLLTNCETFDEAIQLAEAGSSFKIDKRVKDIYGGDYTKFNLSGDTVASNFGHMNLTEKHKEVSRADLARALLEMVTTNIGFIARENADKEAINRVVFIGNFLRVNQLSMKLLSYALNYWSKGAIKALFLEHEGYFGAVGCFVESTRGH